LDSNTNNSSHIYHNHLLAKPPNGFQIRYQSQCIFLRTFAYNFPVSKNHFNLSICLLNSLFG
jgi:hypothetical protein